jgi:GAF domain-containing protein
MAGQGSDVRLTEDDVNYLLTLLRNASSPLTTAQLVEALRQRAARQG